MAQTVKHLLAVRKTLIQSLGRENPLEKETATHSSILAWKVLWREEPSGLQSIGLQRVGTTEHTRTQSVLPVVREIKTVFIIGSIFSSFGLLKKKNIYLFFKNNFEGVLAQPEVKGKHHLNSFTFFVSGTHKM